MSAQMRVSRRRFGFSPTAFRKSLILKAFGLDELRYVVSQRFEYDNQWRRHSPIGYLTLAQFLGGQRRKPRRRYQP